MQEPRTDNGEITRTFDKKCGFDGVIEQTEVPEMDNSTGQSIN
jgi:hypothetical protein